MKVLHFSSAKSWRGGEQQVAYLLTALRKSKVEQLVFCVEHSKLAEFCEAEDFQYSTYKKITSINLIPGFRLAQLIKKNRINIVHIHDAHAHTFACIGASFFGIKTPFVLSRRVDFPIKKSVLSQWKYNYQNIKAILCVSAFIKKVIEPSIKNKSIIKVIHSGIDRSKFQYAKNNALRSEFGITDDQILIANVAAIAPHKDYFTFIDTAALIIEKRSNVRFLIIGADDGEGQKIRAYITQKNVTPFIQFTGFRNDIPKILPGVDLFLFTSKEEGLGTSLLDALACKVPVVATAAGGATEIIEHEQTGLVAEVKNPVQLASHVLRLLDDEDLRSTLVKKGLKKIELFSKETTALKTLETYKEIVP